MLEERLEPLSLWDARELLSEVSRTSLRLARPLVVAVRDERQSPGNGYKAGMCQRLSYLGVKLRLPGNDENEAPFNRGGAGGLAVLESVRITRPLLPQSATLGEALRLCSGTKGIGEVQVLARYDQLVLDLTSSVTSHLPAELLSEPFISLVLSWQLSTEQANSWPLIEGPPALSCADTVHARGGSHLERCLVRRQWADLDFLVQVSSAADDEDGITRSFASGERHLSSDSPEEMVARLFEEEAALAAAEASKFRSQDHEATSSNLADQRAHDFVDRMWQHVLSRCNTARELLRALRLLLQELGQVGAVVPYVRRDNLTQGAHLVRHAASLAALRRAASRGHEQEKDLAEAVDAWQRRCKELAQLQKASSLAVEVGSECIRRDLLHLITQKGCVAAQELAAFQHVCASPLQELDRLRRMRHVAEVAVLCSRYGLCFDATRRLVLKAAEYQCQSCSEARELPATPIFSAPVSNSAAARLLSSFVTVGPTSIAAHCGRASLRMQRRVARGAQEPGVWTQPGVESPFEYNVTVIDRVRYGH